VIPLSLVALGLLVSAFFSAVETALVSANRTRLSHRADAGDAAAARALVLLSDGQRLFGVTLVGATLANTFVTTLATLWFIHRFGAWVVPWLVVALTALLLVTGEIVPKAIARAQADDLTVRLAPPLDALSRFFAPLIGAVNLVATGLVRLLGVKASPARAALNRQDFQLLLDESEETGQVAPGQGRILSRVMDFGEIVVGQAMRPRTEIVAVELGTTVRQVIGVVRQRGFTRIPVYRDDLDQVVGIVHLFDLFRAPSPDLPVDGLLEVCSTVAACKASERASGPRSPSARTRTGSVSPCSNKVPAVTTIAAKINVSRNGTPSGIRKAAARVTTPRRPAQPMMSAYDQGTVESPVSRSRWNSRGRVPRTHASRITMTPPRTAAQKPAICSAESSECELASIILRAWRPIIKKTVFSSRNSIVAQFTRSLRRDCPDWITGDLWPRIKPAITTEMTPEP